MATHPPIRTRKSRKPRKTSPALPSSPPVILFPVGGCAETGQLTEEQYNALMRELRQNIRRHWAEPGVQAVIQFLELNAARVQKQALVPGATPHDAGQGYGVGQMVGLLRAVYLSREEEDAEDTPRTRRR